MKSNRQLLDTEGYVEDFITGERVKATPEEVQAVQVFARQLVEDYGYKKNLIQTRPQYRVKVRPSDIKKEYPVDIAIFLDSQKTEDNIWIIVECKKKNREDGKTQLQDYLRFSKAPLGVWFNGNERLFLKKVEREGRVLFSARARLPNSIPTYKDLGVLIGKLIYHLTHRTT